jgi:serine/threonine protein kinase
MVHRDIKPSNIMVSLEEGTVTARIIDLGLVKAVDLQGFQTTDSAIGVFAGTPAYASPEQFAGMGVDIRSDLYSLGIMLWEMVTGCVPFKGSPAELMCQHQQASLPIEQLKDLPQPVVALVTILLEKDAARRFQYPAEVLRVMPTITFPLEVGRTVSSESLRKLLATVIGAETRKPSAKLAPEKISIARLHVTAGQVFGREEEIAFLDSAWANQQVNIVTIVAWAGVGKSTLVNDWLRRIGAEQYRSAELVFGWSFYRQGTSGDSFSADEFLDAALTWFGDPEPRIGAAWEKGERLAKRVACRRSLLILDGLEPLRNPPGPREGRLREASLQAFLCELAREQRSISLTERAESCYAEYRSRMGGP